jgi:chromosome segregation ATPase
MEKNVSVFLENYYKFFIASKSNKNFKDVAQVLVDSKQISRTDLDEFLKTIELTEKLKEKELELRTLKAQRDNEISSLNREITQLKSLVNTLTDNVERSMPPIDTCRGSSPRRTYC